MGLELIKRAVDATVFLINLTCVLITFVMTVGLVPVCHTAGERRGKRGGMRDSIFQQIFLWSTTNIQHDSSSFNSPVEDVSGGWV